MYEHKSLHFLQNPVDSVAITSDKPYAWKQQEWFGSTVCVCLACKVKNANTDGWRKRWWYLCVINRVSDNTAVRFDIKIVHQTQGMLNRLVVYDHWRERGGFAPPMPHFWLKSRLLQKLSCCGLHVWIGKWRNSWSFSPEILKSAYVKGVVRHSEQLFAINFFCFTGWAGKWIACLPYMSPYTWWCHKCLMSKIGKDAVNFLNCQIMSYKPHAPQFSKD